MKKNKTPIIVAVFLVAWLLSTVAFIVLILFWDDLLRQTTFVSVPPAWGQYAGSKQDRQPGGYETAGRQAGGGGK